MASENLQDIPSGEVRDESYISRSGTKHEPLPVQSDSAPIEDPINEATADSDEQLARDEKDAIDSSNIIDSRTRNEGSKPTGMYREPGDEEGIDMTDGTSSTNQGEPMRNAEALK